MYDRSLLSLTLHNFGLGCLMIGNAGLAKWMLYFDELVM